MTIHQVIAQAGYPVSENAFPEKNKPTLPFVLWEYAGSSDFHADNKPYKKIRTVAVRLCNDGNGADTTAQSRLEEAFLAGKIPYKLENASYNEKEHMTESLYSIEVML